MVAGDSRSDQIQRCRAANEKAVAQYGPDVLVISSGQVNGLTELIVAVDLAPV